MKTFVFSCFLFFVAGQCTAQTTDTTKLNYNIDTLVKQGAVFVMDGVVLQKPYHFNADSIISINIITQGKTKERFESDVQNDLVIMVSKRGAIISYQKKFSALSKKYNEYLLSHKMDDDDILYAISDGKKPALNGSSAELLKKLYEIQVKKIKKVQFIKGENTIMRYQYFAIITIKA